jgi:hypothetical protein
MDFGNPWALVSGALIGLIGTVIFIYGKKQQNLKCLAGGAVLCVFPMFVTSLLAMWGIAAACLAAMYVAARAE